MKLRLPAFSALFLFAILLCSFSSHAQLEVDTSITANRKNVIRVNLTPSLLFGFKNYVMGYERIFLGHNSVSVNLGYLTLPSTILTTELSNYGVNRDRTSFGYSIAIDYRRYFKKKNRGLAPDGLYIGPYLTSYNYWNSNAFTFDQSTGLGTTNATLKTQIGIVNFGVQLGYQFVFWKRATLDLILFGPGLGTYKLNAEITGNLDPNVKDEIYQDIYDAIVEYYPGAGELLENSSISRSGSVDTRSLGYRMVVQVGFLFGK